MKYLWAQFSLQLVANSIESSWYTLDRYIPYFNKIYQKRPFYDYFIITLLYSLSPCLRCRIFMGKLPNATYYVTRTNPELVIFD